MTFRRVRILTALHTGTYARRLVVVPETHLGHLKQEAARIPNLQRIEANLKEIVSDLCSELERTRLEVVTLHEQLSTVSHDLAISERRAEDCYEELQRLSHELGQKTEALGRLNDEIITATNRAIDLETEFPERRSLARDLEVRTQELRVFTEDLRLVKQELAQAKAEIERLNAEFALQGELLAREELNRSSAQDHSKDVSITVIELHGAIADKDRQIEILRRQVEIIQQGLEDAPTSPATDPLEEIAQTIALQSRIARLELELQGRERELAALRGSSGTISLDGMSSQFQTIVRRLAATNVHTPSDGLDTEPTIDWEPTSSSGPLTLKVHRTAEKIPLQDYTGKTFNNLNEWFNFMNFVCNSNIERQKIRDRVPDTFESKLKQHPEIFIPKGYAITLQGSNFSATFRFGGFFSDDSRVYLPCFVTVNGTTTLNYFYSSNSSTSWRIVPIMKTNPMGGGVHLSKLKNELTLNLAWCLQKEVDRLYRSIGAKAVSIEPLKVVPNINIFDSLDRCERESYFGPESDKEAKGKEALRAAERTVSVGLDGPEEKGIRTKRHRQLGDCHKIDVPSLTAAIEAIPDEKKPQYTDYEVSDADSVEYGRYFKIATYSVDQSLLYVFSVTRLGTFLSFVESPSSAITKHGLVLNNDVDIVFPDELFMPVLEYDSQTLGLPFVEKNGSPKLSAFAEALCGDRYVRVQGFHTVVPILKEANEAFLPLQKELRDAEST